MAILKIVEVPDEILRQISEPVKVFDNELGRLFDDMADTLRHARGLGLAGVQVGKLLRVCLVDGEDGLVELVNPVVTHAKKFKSGEEGCLSIPGVIKEVRRCHNVTVRAQDRHGEVADYHFFGIDAVCVQHEIDHMDGILITDKGEGG